MLHESDSLNILNRMKVSAANKLSKSFKAITGKNIEDVFIDEVVGFYEKNWFRLKGVGIKTLSEYENAINPN